MQKKVYARTVKHNEVASVEKKLQAVERNDRVKTTQEFKTLAEQASRSTVYFKNYYVQELREKFKHFDRMKRIDKAFPFAKVSANSSGELVLFDEPVTEIDLDVCLKKAALMKEMGYRYAIIEKDSTLFDVLEQLGAI